MEESPTMTHEQIIMLIAVFLLALVIWYLVSNIGKGGGYP